MSDEICKTVLKNKKKTKKKRSNPIKLVGKIQKQNENQPKISTLRFTPYAWAKLLFLRDYGNSEVGGLGITSANDLLLIEDIQLIQQHCTIATVKFDDESIADFFDDQVELTNITTQGYSVEEVGMQKTAATKSAVEKICPELMVDQIQDRFRSRYETGEAIFCCVDSIASIACSNRSPSALERGKRFVARLVTCVTT